MGSPWDHDRLRLRPNGAAGQRAVGGLARPAEHGPVAGGPVLESGAPSCSPTLPNRPLCQAQSAQSCCRRRWRATRRRPRARPRLARPCEGLLIGPSPGPALRPRCPQLRLRLDCLLGPDPDPSLAMPGPGCSPTDSSEKACAGSPASPSLVPCSRSRSDQPALPGALLAMIVPATPTVPRLCWPGRCWAASEPAAWAARW